MSVLDPASAAASLDMESLERELRDTERLLLQDSRVLRSLSLLIVLVAVTPPHVVPPFTLHCGYSPPQPPSRPMLLLLLRFQHRLRYTVLH
mgnify:FL=1